MTTLLAPNLNVSSLSDRTMLVDLTISQWSGGKTDHKVSAAVAKQYESDKHMGHYYKNLVAREHLLSIRSTASQTYAEHFKRTLPWLDNGSRILSSAGYFDYMSKVKELTDKFDDHVAVFCNNYQSLVFDAQRRLKSLFNEDDYPSVDVIRNKFEIKTAVYPLPISNDFRVDIDPTESARIQADIDRHVEVATQHAVEHLVERIITSVRYMRDRLNDYTGSRQGAFRDSLVENMQELVDLIPTLNVTNDPRFNEVRDQMQGQLAAFSPEVLRKDSATRNSVVQQAEEILNKMRDFM